MTIGCSVWMVRYHVHTDDFMTPLLEVDENHDDNDDDDDDDELLQRRVLIREKEALGERGVAVDSLKQTHARETAKLAPLTDAIAESLAGIHEKERRVAKLDLND
uniref:Uncharacterized protein n=1 Tax=Tanacetum cinerariifolium TaxID=118510 RepID=A0A6L2N5B7_TANCI|nr:hypothetical protein [Tanacetum cinerariifolium]